MRLGALLAIAMLGLAGGQPAAAQGEDAEGCVGKARLRGPLWDTNAGALEPGLGVALDEIARTILERCAGKDIVIEGHAFEAPSAELNQKLAEFRVALVRHELVARGVPAARLMPIALGSSRPLSKAASPLENRRITFRVLD